MSNISVEVTGVKHVVSDATREYAQQKIGKLERYIPENKLEPATAVVRLKETNGNPDEKYEADVVLTLPDKVIKASSMHGNMYAAIDLLEEKAETQLRKYKETSTNHS